ARAERRALGHVGRSLGGDACLAARARGAEQIDPCCDRLDRRQIDMVPRPREFLTCLCERGATRAAFGVDVASGFSASARAAPGWPLRAFFTRVGSATFPF